MHALFMARTYLHSSAMMRSNVQLLLACMILVMAVAADAAPAATVKPSRVVCKDRRFYDCYNVTKYCPDTCPRSCAVNCFTCEPLCLPTQPPPPPRRQSPPPPPKKKKSPPPPKKKKSPPPPPATYSPPPPPSLSPPISIPPPQVSGKRVYCKNKGYPQCYRMEQRCPSSCPDSCEVDCVTCSPVCSKLISSIFHFSFTLYYFLGKLVDLILVMYEKKKKETNHRS